MADLDKAEAASGVDEEGADPTEEVGPDECGVDPAGTELAPGERDGAPEECQFSPMEELIEQFQLAPIPTMISPIDGLITAVDEPVNYAPAFTEDNVVCIADERQFVELFHEELLDRGWAYDPMSLEYVLEARHVRVGTAADGVGFYVTARKAFGGDGVQHTRSTFAPAEVKDMWGHKFVGNDDGAIVPVRPCREKCLHYKRQVFNNDEEPDPNAPGHRVYFPNCMMRRSVGGAFMSLKDQSIYACDYRDPPDQKTVAEHLDSFDRKRVVERPDKTFVPLFGMGGNEVRETDDKAKGEAR
jgi:hypothetical protein